MTATLLVSVWLALLAPFQKPIVPVDPWNMVDPSCETITDLNPEGPVYDMLDWTTLDPDLRATSHMASDLTPAAYVNGTVVTADRITYLKTMSGDTWDVNVVDDVGIWAWRTEYRWNQPRNFTQFRRPTIMHAPRIGRGGYPGMRWVNCDTAYAARVECGGPANYGHLGYVIHELYGPYNYDPGYGDVRGPILKIAYYYGCSRPETGSCGSVEITWTSQRYGQFGWRLYERRGGEWVQTGGGPPTVYVVPGVIPETFPCDQEIP